MSEIIKVKVPASTSNLGPGFDTLSLALDLYNEFTFKVTKDGLKINQHNSNKLPEDSTNLVYKSFCEPFKKLKKTPPGIELDINCQIPLAAGLGSSASAVVSGILAANTILNNALKKDEILSLATKLEGHPDNCASAIFGGLTISVSFDEKVYVSQFPWPKELLIIIVIPDFELPTRISRELLPAKVSYGDATFNVSRTAFLLSSLLSKDWNALCIGFQDRLHQPFRKDLVPGMEAVLKEAINKGAFGATLSGAGPTLAAFVNDKNKAEEIGKSMTEKWQEFKVKSNYKVLNASIDGAKTETLVMN
ncbi:MAG: homoserine kinase [Candidatus Melainabacteria bacterium]|nr:homoserine kinase [Candidatus Melainabacteria bacterium]